MPCSSKVQHKSVLETFGQEMEKKMKALKSWSGFHGQKIGIMLIGCFLASMTFLALSKPYEQLSMRSTLHANQTNTKAESGNQNVTWDPVSDKGAKKVQVQLPEDSSTGSNSTHNIVHSKQLGAENVETERKALCYIDRRADLCEMTGDIRVHGNSSTVTLLTSSQIPSLDRNESYRIRPYARKGDEGAMSHVREVFVRADGKYSQCTINHTVPAIIFSVSGYSGNLFHDFTDTMIPLFLTSREFNGEVQFLVTNMNPWWFHKYKLVLSKLSKYQGIDFDKDNRVHCFKHVIVGLKCHKELSIDPLRAPNGYSMRDFTNFMRSAYALEREVVLPSQRPRLLIISRNRTRAFTNVDEIVLLARDLGFEPVVAEPKIWFDVGQFARIVNSCDVMMGVHGAGLTNLVYLPTGATVIQVVPWGGLGWVARYDFGEPAKDMGLKYLQYEISPEESSLIEVYPRDHPVFKDPLSFHKGGWNLLRATFMDGQNVRLDVKRFRAVLLEALALVHK